MDKPTIGIIGLGMVGGALDAYYQKNGYKVLRKDLNFDDGVAEADFIFISVPTPYSEELKGYDLSAVRDSLAAIPEGKPVILKSTIAPGTTDMLQEEFPGLAILFNPEFLTEASTDMDFNDPDRQIIGYTENSRRYAQQVLDLLPKASYNEIMPAKEAEMIKLAGNAFMSLKVIFYNQIYDICEQSGLNYDLVRGGVTADRRVGPSHADIWHGGFRGFGGKCLPKDLNALIAFAEESGLQPELLDLIRKTNNKLTCAE